MESERYNLWLSFALGTQNKKIAALLQAFDGDAKAVFRAAQKRSLPMVVKSDILDVVYSRANEDFIMRCLRRLNKLNVSVCTIHSSSYPALLKEIYDPPPVLYYRGELRGDIALPIAMVGSRNATDYGKHMAQTLARELACSGCCIISGMAHGIDAAAATGALEAMHNDYPTIAVLGGGVDVVYPESNRGLYERIIERSGAVLSEQMPGTAPMKGMFPLRNRIISGMARGVVVVEAAEKSGASITADQALEQGRDLFAVPGRISDGNSVGTNGMLRAGNAKMVLCAEDVLEEYGAKSAGGAGEKIIDEAALSFEGALLVRLLRAGERSFDELCDLTAFSPSVLNSNLTDLEFSGIIKQLPGRMYSL